MSRIYFRDEKTGRFTKPHKQKHISVHYREDDGTFSEIQSARRGIDRLEADILKYRHESLERPTTTETLTLRARHTIHETLKPYANKIGKFDYADITIRIKGEEDIKLNKVKLSDLPYINDRYRRTKRDKPQRRKQKKYEKIRQETKFALMLQSYAVTAKAIRERYGDKQMRHRKTMKTVKPQFIIRLHKVKK